MSIPLTANVGVAHATAPAVDGAHGAARTEKEKAADKDKTVEAARQFEALLLRHVLSSLEKTTSIGGPKKSGANSTYQSMVVDALADGIAQAGGLGLSDLVARMLEGEMGKVKT